MLITWLTTKYFLNAYKPNKTDSNQAITVPHNNTGRSMVSLQWKSLDGRALDFWFLQHCHIPSPAAHVCRLENPNAHQGHRYSSTLLCISPAIQNIKKTHRKYISSQFYTHTFALSQVWLQNQFPSLKRNFEVIQITHSFQKGLKNPLFWISLIKI